MNTNDIGITIRQERKAKGIQQRELAKMAGISQNALVNIEKGRSYPTLNTLSALCKILDLSLLLVPRHCIVD